MAAYYSLLVLFFAALNALILRKVENKAWVVGLNVVGVAASCVGFWVVTHDDPWLIIYCLLVVLVETFVTCRLTE
jgi:cyanate permease